MRLQHHLSEQLLTVSNNESCRSAVHTGTIVVRIEKGKECANDEDVCVLIKLHFDNEC